MTSHEASDSQPQTYRMVVEFTAPSAEIAARSEVAQETITRLGGVVLHAGIVDPAFSRLAATQEAEQSDRIPFITPEHPLYDVINISLPDLLDNFSEPEEGDMLVRLHNNLYRDGVRNLRDIFVFGYSKVFDMRNVGNKQMRLIEALLQRATNGELTWVDEPTVSDIAHYCTNLSKIRAGVIDTSLAKFSIREILETDDATLLQALRPKWLYKGQHEPVHIAPVDYWPRVNPRVVAFAEDFSAARTQLELTHALPEKS